MPTSCSHYFRETIRGAERMGLDGDTLLAEINVTRAEINDPGWRGRTEHLARLVQLVWLATGDEFLGLTRHRCKCGTFAMIAHNLLREETLEQVLHKAVFYYGLVTEDIRMEITSTPGTLTLHIIFSDPELDPSHYLLDFWLSIWYRLISWMGGALAPLEKAIFAYPRPETRQHEFKYMFPTTHEFDAVQSALVFDRPHLQSPVVRSRDELKNLLAIAPLGFMATPTDVTSYTRQIRNLLMPEKRFPLEFPSFTDVSEEIGVGEQTLRRKLRQEATSFRELKESIRRDLAIEKLIRGNHSVAMIAEMLGYSETRAFTRAFKQWTGMSPVRYRDHFQTQFYREGSARRS